MTAIQRTDGLVTINRIFIVRNGRILILKRSEDNRSHVGFWELPGGTVEPGMQRSVEDEADRELLEETGYVRELTLLTAVAFGDDNTILPKDQWNRIKFLTYYWYVEIDSEPVKRSGEHSAINWCTLDKLENMPDALTPRTVAALAFLRNDLRNRLMAAT